MKSIYECVNEIMRHANQMKESTIIERIRKTYLKKKELSRRKYDNICFMDQPGKKK